jgi:hypothetical protein
LTSGFSTNLPSGFTVSAFTFSGLAVFAFVSLWVASVSKPLNRDSLAAFFFAAASFSS